MNLTLDTYISGVADGSLNPQKVLDHYLDKASQDKYNAYARIHRKYASSHAEAFFSLPLAGAPIAVKDNFLVTDTITSCGSKMLENYISTYTSSVVAHMEAQGGLVIGKTNMDEFAMGSSTQTCYFGPTLNPLDTKRIPGGSSGGSAAAVAADLCIAALGTDTAGSVRQPAAMCGIVGVKPTYGRTSRYGIQSMSSSLDQAGVLTKTVLDAAILLDAISGKDQYDAMTVDPGDNTSEWRQIAKNQDLKGKKIALPKEFLGEGLDERILGKLQETIIMLEEAGAIIEEVSASSLLHGVPTYYILCPAEVSTNLSRFDGIKFGVQDETSNYQSIDEYYAHIRQTGFGPEVLRRIMLGTYVLSAGFYDAYYHKAQLVRAKMIKEVEQIFESYDAIIGPTSPILPRNLGEKMDDPIQMYLADIYTVIANLTGIPAMSVPMGLIEQEGVMLPAGCQLMTKHRDEKTLFQIGSVVEHGRESQK